ncbi:hypothetical protein AB4Z38_07120 [Arthrobacter sp. 2RAF6]|uniref:hypothetical protein n=1 Tax=Arthrobacter sp. 2RAF6 TaxID=3233002 RepID=UPI003F932DA9
MTTDTGVRKPGSRLTGAGLVIAVIGAILLIAGIIGSGSISAFSAAIVVVGLVVAGVGFARRVLAALESR